VGRGRGGLGGGDFYDEMAGGVKAFWGFRQGKEFGGKVGVAIAFPVRWVCEDEIVGGCVAFEDGEDVGFDDMAACEFGFEQIFLGGGGGVAVFVDEGAGGCSTGEGFEAKCAGAAEEVEDSGVDDEVAEDGEYGLAYEVRGRAGDACGDFDGGASCFSCDDSHWEKFQILNSKLQEEWIEVIGCGFFNAESQRSRRDAEYFWERMIRIFAARKLGGLVSFSAWEIWLGELRM